MKKYMFGGTRLPAANPQKPYLKDSILKFISRKPYSDKFFKAKVLSAWPGEVTIQITEVKDKKVLGKIFTYRHNGESWKRDIAPGEINHDEFGYSIEV